MRIGDRARYAGSHGWAAGREVEIKGVVRDNRAIRDNEILDALGGIKESDQIIFSVMEPDGFRYSSPEGRLCDFWEGVAGPEKVDFTTLV